jgi:two-component sensor histidine kinase
VKNNLHTIICLLESQASFLENDALEAIEKSHNRIYTMSLIHQKLYQADDMQKIDMSGYIPELIQYLRDSFENNSDRIRFHLDIDPVCLAPSVAIPVGLIINEALTNSIKYAFPGDRLGEIRILLKETDGAVRLDLSDNGIGIVECPTYNDPVSLGLQLINGLTKEIMGDIYITSRNGFKVTVTFNKHG